MGKHLSQRATLAFAALGLLTLSASALEWRASRASHTRRIDRSLSSDSAEYALTMNGREVGRTRIALRTKNGTLSVQETGSLRAAAPDGTVEAATMRATSELSMRGARLLGFDITVSAETGSDRSETTRIRSRRSLHGTLETEIETGGRWRAADAVVPPGAAPGAAFWSRFAARRVLKPGTTYRELEYDPVAGKATPVFVRLIEKRRSLSLNSPLGQIHTEGATYHVSTYGSAALAFDGWIDRHGLPVAGKTALGVQIVRLDRVSGALVVPDTSAGTKGSLIVAGAVRGAEPLRHMSKRNAVRFWISGLPAHMRMQTSYQAWNGGHTLTVSPVNLPRAGTDAKAMDRDSASRYLAEEPFIETKSKEIRSAAARWADVTNAVSKAAMITKYVYTRTAKRYTPSWPSAVETLMSGQGDCNEHTALVVALLRASGIPARPVVGLAASEGRFFYHAWAEAWLRDRWVPLDATFGEFPASTHRIALLGSLRDANGVLSTIGMLRISVLNGPARAGEKAARPAGRQP